MTDDNATPNPPAVPSQPAAFSGRYLVTVGGLLVLIIAMLAVLWMRERSRRVEAEAAVVQLKEKAAQLPLLLSMMTRSMPGPGSAPAAEEPSLAPIRPFQRQDQVPVTVTLDGVKREAFCLPADGAARFGFREGDVILVVGPKKAAASAPGPESTGSGR